MIGTIIGILFGVLILLSLIGSFIAAFQESKDPNSYIKRLFDKWFH